MNQEERILNKSEFRGIIHKVTNHYYTVPSFQNGGNTFHIGSSQIEPFGCKEIIRGF